MMKKIFASLAAGLIIASAVPAMAAETGAGSDNYRPGYCWQADGSQSDDGYYCGRRHRRTWRLLLGQSAKQPISVTPDKRNRWLTTSQRFSF